jgi:hypothetical protein
VLCRPPLAGQRRHQYRAHTLFMDDDDDMLRGLPVTRHDPLTFPGGMEQYGKMAAAAGSQTGWRLVIARIGIVLIAVSVITPLIVWLLAGR